MTDGIAVRPIERDDDMTRQYQAAAREFSGERDPSPEQLETLGERWRVGHLTRDTYRPEQLRGAYDGDMLLGGYIIHEREMVMGSARLLTGCIAAVVTYPEHRRRGVGRALMLDAIQFARESGHALLLLDGISNFYTQFGYLDVWEYAQHRIRREAIAHLQSSHTVRPASVDDVPALLGLYNRHLGSRPGSFARTERFERWLVEGAVARGNPPLVAEGPDGLEGYLRLGLHSPGQQGGEVASDTWAATCALLQAHNAAIPADSDATDITWLAPQDEPAVLEIEERLQMPDLGAHDSWEFPTRTEIIHSPRAIWQGRSAHLPTLLQALTPVLQERWAGARSSCRLVIHVEDEEQPVDLNDGSRDSSSAGAELHVRLSPGRLAQLVCGFRRAPYVARQPGEEIPADAIPVLERLFPPLSFWIPRTDWF